MSFRGWMTLLGAVALIAPSAARAQDKLQMAEAPTVTVEKEVARDAVELKDVIRTHPVDRDTVNTALGFTNTGATTTVVYCTAFDHQGRAVGRTRTKVPARGVRFVFASDLSNGRDFIGNALCSTDGRVSGSVVLLGGVGTTDLNVEQSPGRARALIRFPLIATY